MNPTDLRIPKGWEFCQWQDMHGREWRYSHSFDKPGKMFFFRSGTGDLKYVDSMDELRKILPIYGLLE